MVWYGRRIRPNSYIASGTRCITGTSITSGDFRGRRDTVAHQCLFHRGPVGIRCLLPLLEHGKSERTAPSVAGLLAMIGLDLKKRRIALTSGN